MKNVIFDRKNLIISFTPNHCDIQVDLAECTNSAEMLHWILFLSGTRGYASLMSEFLECLNDATYQIFGKESQDVFCSREVGHTVDWKTGTTTEK